MVLVDLRKMLALSWDHKSGGRNQNNQAHRISAVKRGPETPGFSQQQEDNQQREDGSNRGRGGKRYRGKRGGKKPQAQTAEEQPQAGPSNSASTAQSSPGTLEFGFMASSAQIPPHTSFYPSFSKAINLARRIDVPITTETLKRLEFVEDPKDVASRPLKKRKIVDVDNEVDLEWSGNEEVDAFMDESAGPSQRCVITLIRVVVLTPPPQLTN
jgi:hypothetical protein